jgi:hypothetical protein
MTIAGLSFEQNHAFAAGDAYDEDIAVEGIRSGDDLLYVIGITPATGAFAASHAVADFTVGAGTITAASIDTTGQRLAVGWTRIP